MLQRTRNGALMLSGQASVFPGKNLAGVGDVTAHRLRLREWNFRGCGRLLLLFGRAHA